ncbi:Alpha/Beta hydrolase protein [Astrocystis sublimbata]|nr:Alpha/Beta hydrolase protein [Astrocystis sublimbata]
MLAQTAKMTPLELRKMHLLLCRIVLFAYLVAGAHATLSAAPERTRNSKADWHDCPGGPNTIVKCADVPVPLDHENPTSTQITLKVARIKTTSSRPLGTLFFNPGGPGGSAVANILAISALPSSSLYQTTSRYDLVGVDPRGAGYSTPMRCDPALWNRRVKTAVTDEAEFESLVRHYAAVGASCANLTGALINHLDTVSVAKDHEVVRRYLGAEKFNFLGLSWGSQIGYTYAEMYPERVGRMALQGIVDHSEAATTAVQSMTTSYEATMRKFIAWCRSNTTCALHDRDPRAVLESVVAKAHKTPIPAPRCRQSGPDACAADVSDEELLTNAQTLLALAPPRWNTLAQGLLSALRDDDATVFANPYFTADTDVDFTSAWANLGTGCQDWGHPATSYLDVRNLVRQTTALSPLTKGFGQSFQWYAMCIGWPSPLSNPPRKIHRDLISRAPEILLANAYWDPETSVQWAVGVRAQIPNSRLVFYDGSGHAAYADNGDTARAVNGFLLGGEMPGDGTVYGS